MAGYILPSSLPFSILLNQPATTAVLPQYEPGSTQGFFLLKGFFCCLFCSDLVTLACSRAKLLVSEKCPKTTLIVTAAASIKFNGSDFNYSDTEVFKHCLSVRQKLLFILEVWVFRILLQYYLFSARLEYILPVCCLLGRGSEAVVVQFFYFYLDLQMKKSALHLHWRPNAICFDHV